MPSRGRPPKGVFIPADLDLPDLLALWNKALDSPYGISFPSANPKLAEAKLHHARRACGHQGFSALRVVATESEVFIIPK